MKAIIRCFRPMFILIGIQIVCAMVANLLNIPHDNNFLMKQMLMYDIIGLGLFGYIWITKIRPLKPERKRSSFTFASVLMLILLFIALEISISGMLSILTKLVPDIMSSYSTHIENMGIANMRLLTITVTIVLTPILEEIAYRGDVFEMAMHSYNSFTIANIMQAAVFGISHLNLIQSIYAFIMGLFLGYVYKRYNTILAPIIGHITFNIMGTFGVRFIFGSVTTIWQALFITGGALIITGISFALSIKNNDTVSHI